VSLTISPVFDELGQLVQFVSVQSDMTKRHILDEEKARSQEILEEEVRRRTVDLEKARDLAERATVAKSDFVATMSHEIRTPLNAVLGYNQLLSRETLTARQQELVAKTQKAGFLLKEIVDNALDFSKIDSGIIELEKESFDLAKVLEGVDVLTGTLAREQGLVFTWAIDEQVPPLLVGDEQRLTQILINLTSNAVKFTSSGSIALRVRSKQLEGSSLQLLITVADTGVGISPENIERIFEPYHQSDASTARIYGGTGLGLGIARRLAQLMGGDIYVTSELGSGSSFLLEILVQVSAAPVSLPTSNAPRTFPALRGARVLIVEDNLFNQDVASEILELEGIESEVAGDGIEALGVLAASQPFGVILMDISMPRMDGIETTRRIREDPIHASTPIIALTAGAPGEELLRYLDLGFDDALGKPFHAEELFVVLQRWLSPEMRHGAAPEATVVLGAQSGESAAG